MQGFHRKRAIDRTRLGLAALSTVALMIGAFVSLRAAWGMYQKLLAATDEEQVAQVQLAQLENQASRIGKASAALSTERGIETEVRSRYGAVKPGEGEIRIVQSTASTSAQNDAPKGFFARLWQALFVW